MRRSYVTGRIFVSLAVVLLVGCTAPTPRPQPTATVTGSHETVQTFPTRFSDAGRVVVDVTPLNLDRPEDTLHFRVGMNTHSVDLSYDLAQLAVLRTDRGDEVAALRWDGAMGGHHVNGTLYFPAVNLEGVQWLEVVIRGVAGVSERVFRWELP
ncbi:MAG: hypothetical protein ACE5MB_06650 [Anaerolineae bacterium]